MLTGASLNEILKAKWSRIDFERGILFLADSKTGKKPIYLSAAAQAIINAIPRIEDNPHLIAGTKQGKPRSDLNRPWTAIRRAAGLADVRIHDLRHTFDSFGAGAALSLPVIGKLLGHSQPSTTARYAHLDADPMHRAVNRIGGDISAAMSGEIREVAADVVDTIWTQCGLANPDHPSMNAKGISPHGARVTGDGRLVVPLLNIEGELTSLQYIDQDGGKLYHSGGQTGGYFWMLGDLDPLKKLYIAEGFATAATIREVTECPVAIAYSASNLVPVTA